MTRNASPIQDISLASPISTTNTTNNAGIFSSPSRLARADIVTCLLLVVELPEGILAGTFHNAGVRDAFQLPVSLAEIGCQLFVTIPPHMQDISNWPAVRFAANQIIAACTVGDYPSGSTGGFARVGRNGDIRVTVSAPSVGDLGVA